METTGCNQHPLFPPPPKGREVAAARWLPSTRHEDGPSDSCVPDSTGGEGSGLPNEPFKSHISEEGLAGTSPALIRSPRVGEVPFGNETRKPKPDLFLVAPPSRVFAARQLELRGLARSSTREVCRNVSGYAEYPTRLVPPYKGPCMSQTTPLFVLGITRLPENGTTLD